KYGIAGGITAALATILFFLATQQAPLSRLAPVVNMSVMVAVFLGVVVLKEELNIRAGIGIVLAVISIYLLSNSN
ncbi:MAG TPA: EamA family transporter, partial [Candidatus Methanoperedenaceae archaeon]|nr:EamA family transporter [Candidatus Methanoperedenaceae archaeon]